MITPEENIICKFCDILNNSSYNGSQTGDWDLKRGRKIIIGVENTKISIRILKICLILDFMVNIV